jgi:hypothetical protein
MNTGTFVQRVAQNYYQNVIPLPEQFDIADEVRGDCPPDRLRDGLFGLHRWMTGVYRGAADSPGDFGLPWNTAYHTARGQNCTSQARPPRI